MWPSLNSCVKLQLKVFQSIKSLNTYTSMSFKAMVAGGTILLVDPERPPAAVPIASRVGHLHQPPARRSSHNAIERRYRSSINERMGELRALLAGPNSKLHKSAVLRKAVDYIRYLQEVNRRLRKQNRTLRCSLQPCGKHNILPDCFLWVVARVPLFSVFPSVCMFVCMFVCM
uniref:BHLH domain-containing protein n=1 Tax=Eptatretus burgeri TaxID=7764 RepID=A0A8C4R2N4_EPTBU